MIKMLMPKNKCIDYAHDCIGVTKKVVQDISGRR